MAMDPEKAVYLTTWHIVKQLTDQELFALNNAVMANFDPRRVMGYEKAKTLFTETVGGKPIMHDLTRSAFNTLVHERLEAMNK